MLSLVPDAAAHLDAFCAVVGPDDLSPEQVRSHDPDAMLMVTDGGQAIGRASLWWQSTADYPGQRLGIIGHYAAPGPEAAGTILSSACERLAQAGCTFAVGPMDGNTWRRYRLITDRGGEPVFFLEPDNPDDWPRHFEQAGFRPLAHYYSAINDDVGRCRFPIMAAERLARQGFSIRPLNTADIDGELPRLWDVSRRAFTNNFLYMPISLDGFLAIYGPLVNQVDPRQILVAELQSEAVGFCFSLADLLQRRRSGNVDTVIVKTIAVVPEYQRMGLGSLLFAHAMKTARSLGMRRAIVALMHEDNPSRKLDQALMRQIRRYALFAKPL